MAEGYKDWAAGDILTAADLEDYTVKQSVMRFADASARTTALSGVLAEGMMSYLKDTDSVEVYDGSSWAAVGQAGGKILQIVRATDATDRYTSSTSFVDADISVTITPTSASSDVMLVWAYLADGASAARIMQTQITDSSNNAISGAENAYSVPAGGMMQTVIGYDSPATTSATTYKGRFKAGTAATVYLLNATNTAQLFAIEVGA